MGGGGGGGKIKCEACNKLNKFNKIGAQMFYLSNDIKIILNHIFGVKMLGFCHIRDVKSVIT